MLIIVTRKLNSSVCDLGRFRWSAAIPVGKWTLGKYRDSVLGN